MKFYFSFIIFTFLLLFSQNLSAQNSDTDSTSSHTLIEKGIGLHEAGKFDEAIRIYNSVSKCDPNYWWACYESALSYYYLDKSDTALAKCRESDDFNPEHASTIALTGNLLNELGKTSEAIAYLEKALKTWPYNQNMLYNIAVCYVNDGQLEKAEQMLIRSIRINPYHKSSHLLLAKVNFYMGRIAQSYLCYNMAIVLNPRVNYIGDFEKAITGKLDALSHPYNYPYTEGSDHQKWDELSWFLKSEMAFNKEFEYDYKMNYITIRQSLMLFRKMSFTPADTSIYNQFYVRFYSELINRNYLDTYFYYAFKNSDNKIVTDWVKENQPKLDAFTTWAQSTINSWRNYGFSMANETKKEKIFHYNSDGDLSAVGTMKTEPAEEKYGPWLTINPEGGIEEKGTYANNKVEGIWQIFWPNGKVKQNLAFRADELDGTSLTFYPTTVRAGIYTRVGGKRNGPEEKFISSGKLLSGSLYRNDTLVGKKIKYDYDEGFVQEASYISGKTEGKVTEKWLNGNPKSEIGARDSLFNGDFRSWYSNGKSEAKGFYKNDTVTGKWANYFPDGSKRTEGEFDANGKLTGTRLTYFRNGKLEMEEATYANGSLSGIVTIYFANGTVRSKKTFKEDRLIKLECFDNKGNSLYTAEETRGLLNNRTYYADGILESEGVLKDGEYDGKWTFYNPQGRVSQELQYENGFQSGKQLKYHENGVIKQEFSCDSNRIIGLFREYFSSGNLNVSGWYNKNGRTGEWVSRFSNDSIQSKLFYTDNVRVGRQYFFSPTGKVSSEEYFNDEGKSIRLKQYDVSANLREDQKYEYDSVAFNEYYPSGVLRAKKMIVNNTPHGVIETYFPNGKLQSQKPYIYGLADGIGKNWDYTGKLTFEIPYVMGERNGLTKGYRDGKLWYTDMYEYGKSEGKYTEYYSNGHIQRSLSFENDMKEGNSDYFAPDSSFMYRLIYAGNTIKAYTYKDAKGNLLPEKPIDLKMTLIQCYYANGKLSASIPLKNGVPDGLMKTFYPGGNIMQEKVYVNNNFDGVYKYYYENGKPNELISYKNDDRNGSYETYYKNGQIHEKGWLIAGQIQGEWLIYSEDGKLVNTLYYDNDELYDIK